MEALSGLRQGLGVFSQKDKLISPGPATLGVVKYGRQIGLSLGMVGQTARVIEQMTNGDAFNGIAIIN
jgi:hypothetical protein